MTDKKVYEILKKIRIKIKKDNNLNTKIFKNVVKNGTNMFELCINPFYDVKGLSKDLNSDENLEFWSCMEEIRIEYFTVIKEPPLFIKLLSIIGFTMYTRHTINMIERIKTNQNREIFEQKCLNQKLIKQK